MNRVALAALVTLCACAKDGGRSAAAASDSAANAAAAQAPAADAAPAPPTGMMGTPAYARQGVDSSNAAQQQRLDQVNELSDQASGAKQP
jgi:hypothetical protein